MSQVLESRMIQIFSADPTVLAAIGKDTNGNPAIFPYHQRDVDERVAYPHITIARFGDITESGKFQDSPDLAMAMDCPKVSLCVWSTRSLDEAYPIYNAVDSLMRGAASNVSSQYHSIYKVRRTHLRDDLFDTTAKAFHIHSEYAMWIRNEVSP